MKRHLIEYKREVVCQYSNVGKKIIEDSEGSLCKCLNTLLDFLTSLRVHPLANGVKISRREPQGVL